MRHGVILLTLLLFAPATARGGSIDWMLETVEGGGARASLVIDSQNDPHVFHMLGSDVRHAERVGGTWYKALAAHWDYRMGPDALILPGDIPAFTSGGVFFYLSAQGWVVEDMGNDGFWCSAAEVGPDGVVYGVSQGSFGSGLYIGFVDEVERHNGAWTYGQRLTSTVFYPSSPSSSVTLDASGEPHISFTATSTDPLRYAHRTSGAWTVDPLGAGLWSSIAIDAQGSPRISFYDPDAKDLVLATRSNNAWILTHLDQTGDVGLYTSQAILNNVSYVSYYDQTNGNLMFAVFSDPEHFASVPVDVDGDVGQWTSLAFDSQGRPYIAYQDVTNGTLKVAIGQTALPARKMTLGSVKSLYRK